VRLINEMCKHSCSNIYSKQDTDSRNAHTQNSGLDLGASAIRGTDRDGQREKRCEMMDGSFLFAQTLSEVFLKVFQKSDFINVIHFYPLKRSDKGFFFLLACGCQ